MVYGPIKKLRGMYHHGNNIHIECEMEILKGDVVKCIIDMKLGVLCFVNFRTNQCQAFRINKYVDYRFVIVNCTHQYSTVNRPLDFIPSIKWQWNQHLPQYSTPFIYHQWFRKGISKILQDAAGYNSIKSKL